MAFNNAADLAEAREFGPQNLSQAFFNAPPFPPYIEDFEFQFFGLLNPTQVGQQEIYRWVVPWRFVRERLTAFQPKNEDLYQLMRLLTFACQEARRQEQDGTISASLASDLVDAYNNVFS